MVRDGHAAVRFNRDGSVHTERGRVSRARERRVTKEGSASKHRNAPGPTPYRFVRFRYRGAISNPVERFVVARESGIPRRAFEYFFVLSLEKPTLRKEIVEFNRPESENHSGITSERQPLL